MKETKETVLLYSMWKTVEIREQYDALMHDVQLETVLSIFVGGSSQNRDEDCSYGLMTFPC